MTWRDYKYDELMEEGAGHLLRAQPLQADPSLAQIAAAQLQATHALACFALARELREAEHLQR